MTLLARSPERFKSLMLIKTRLPDYTINRLWMILSALVIILFVINALQIGLLHIWLIPIELPACILAASLLIIGIWLALNGLKVKQDWQQASGPQRTTWISIFLTLILPYSLSQFMYMETVALPAWQRKSWTVYIEEPAYMATPALRIMHWSDKGADPQLSIGFTCFKKDLDNFSCNHMLEPNNFTGHGWQTWSVFPAHHNGSSMSMKYQFMVTASVKARKPEHLVRDGSLNSLWMYLWDAKVLRNGNSRFGCGRNKNLRLPWDSSRVMKVGFSQSVFEDNLPMLNSGSRTCTNSNLTKYTMYRATLEPENILGNGTKCATGKCDVEIQVLPNDLTTHIYQGDRAKDKITMIVEEAGVLGGVAFFTWFLSIYGMS